MILKIPIKRLVVMDKQLSLADKLIGLPLLSYPDPGAQILDPAHPLLCAVLEADFPIPSCPCVIEFSPGRGILLLD